MSNKAWTTRFFSRRIALYRQEFRLQHGHRSCPTHCRQSSSPPCSGTGPPPDQSPHADFRQRARGRSARGARRQSLIRENNSAGLKTVLGLPTGSTPIGVYRELIRLHREESLDFSNVVTFNLDEYWPMPKDSIHSYNRFMRETFFDHVNIPPENIHIPDGTIPLRDVDAFCDATSTRSRRLAASTCRFWASAARGNRLQRAGQPRDSRTRIVTLDPVTRQDAASDFYGEENVPSKRSRWAWGRFVRPKNHHHRPGRAKAPIVRRPSKSRRARKSPRVFCRRIAT